MTVGILFHTDAFSGKALVDHARRLESLGVESMWLAELFGREPFATAGILLANTSRLRIATGIANIYVRDAIASAAAARTLAEYSNGRFVLGLGVSNAQLNSTRGHAWQAPVPTMRKYLQAIRNAKLSVSSDARAPILIAAHAPGLMRLGATLADGITTYLMTPEHTAQARAALGHGPELTVMMMALQTTDSSKARNLAKRLTSMYTVLDYYHRAWSKLGFDANDFGQSPSDRLLDALVAWGDVHAIKERIQAHRSAGATRVVVIPPDVAQPSLPDYALIEALARH